MRRRLTLIVIVVLIAVAGAGAYMLLRVARPRTVADAVAKYGAAARARIKPDFARAGVTYPPKRIALLVFKREGRVSLWADGHFIRAYPILAASGHAGPKLRQGDYQVPEGVYRIEWLNPNSSYHKNVSIGCVALGDPAIEELFTLVADTGHQRVRVIIAPNDLRTGGAILHESAPRWVGQLYRSVAAALAEFPVWMESNAAIDVRGMSKGKLRFK